MIIDDLSREEQLSESNDYQFADGDLSTFQTDFSAPKQDMNIEEEPENFEDETEELSNGSEQPAISAAKAARNTARFLAPIIDQGTAFGLSLVSKNETESHKLDKDGIKELERLIAEYAKESGGNIPIWMQLVLFMITMYGFQLPKALADRKLNNERMALENERKALEIERKNYETKIIELNAEKKPENGSESN